MAQVVAPFAFPSVATAHPALSGDLIEAYGLDHSVAQGEIITVQAVQEADGLVQALEADKGRHAEFTDDVLQTATDRAHMLSEIHAETAFNVPTPQLEPMNATIQGLVTTVQRLEARLDNIRIVKRNRILSQTDSDSLSFNARQKEVAGDGLALAVALAPPNVELPAQQGNPQLGDVMSPTINYGEVDDAQILALIRFYNEDFRIVPADDISMRARKIRMWLTFDV
ncbi:hypothetical protein C8F01DRAFT_1224715 [Mycena amicta]|nr:hypothetical protein C8F01DRAFT_1224715 [Mycena amicta]